MWHLWWMLSYVYVSVSRNSGFVVAKRGMCITLSIV